MGLLILAFLTFIYNTNKKVNFKDNVEVKDIDDTIYMDRLKDVKEYSAYKKEWSTKLLSLSQEQDTREYNNRNLTSVILHSSAALFSLCVSISFFLLSLILLYPKFNFTLLIYSSATLVCNFILIIILYELVI